MSINITEELSKDFIEYSHEVNFSRSFPDIRDGLKPSQRAVIWAAYENKFTSDKPHVKCAKLDGCTIANYWPHGSEYSTIVRMSQPWLNNISEIDFHGANGSLLGGPDAAAARYTECRLAKATEEGMLGNISKDTVEMIPNFSEDLKWPSVLPSILPRLFVNGSQGIGFCLAQEWEPGNLKEFYSKVDQYIKTGKVTCNDIYPDYPSGGIIINKKDIHTIYETGKGNIILRGKATIEDDLIKITSLPYQIYAEPFIQKIKDLVNNETITTINDIYNKSDDSGMLIEIECTDPQATLEKLYRVTDLQVTFNANQMAVYDNKVEMFTLVDYIKAYLKHNIQCLVNEFQYDLNKATNRLELVQGYIIATNNVDTVIYIIKNAADSNAAKASLKERLNVTDNQAAAIIALPIGKLTKLDESKFNAEIAELNKIIAKCNKIINSDKEQKSEFMKRLKSFVDKYSWDRRTEVTDVDVVKERIAAKKVAKAESQFVIAFTADKNVKRIPIADYRAQTKIKNKGDEITHSIVVGLREKFTLISSTGKMYKLQANNIPLGSMSSSGKPVNIDDDIIGIFDCKSTKQYFVFVTNNKMIKKINAAEVLGISKKIGTVIMKLDNEVITNVFLTDDSIDLNGKTYNITKYKPKGRSAGGVIFRELK